MEKLKIGVLGVKRGQSMIFYSERAKNVEVVAICDKWEDGLKRMSEKMENKSVAMYTDFEEFLNHDMDIVVLANYGN